MEIPSYVEQIIEQFWQYIVSLVGKQLKKYYFEEVSSDHWLVEFDKYFETSYLEEKCAAYHQGKGQGSWTVHSIRCLVRGLIAKYLFNMSYRETEEKVKYNILVRLWVGYGLFREVFDHSTLQRFEKWVLLNHNLLFFEEIQRQIDEQHKTKHKELQIIDSFAVIGRAIEQNIITLLRQVSKNILNEIEKEQPQLKAEIESQLNIEDLFGKEDERATNVLKKAERAERLQKVGEQVIRLQGLVAELEPVLLAKMGAAKEWQACLTKIIADRLQLKVSEEETETELKISERANKDKGSYYTVSNHDPEMTIRVHGKKKVTVGYNASLMSDEYYIRHTQVDTGSRPDNLALPDMLKHYQEHQKPLPKKVSADMAYTQGKTRATVAGVSEGQTMIVAKYPDASKGTERFSPSDFILDDTNPQQPSLTCPEQKTTTSYTRDKRYDGLNFRFPVSACKDCPFFKKCRGDSNPKYQRTVFISDYRSFAEEAILYNQTEQAQSELKQRPIIERHIYNLTNLFGARRAKSYGLIKVNFQVRMAAMAFNIRQFLRYGTVEQKSEPQPATG